MLQEALDHNYAEIGNEPSKECQRWVAATKLIGTHPVSPRQESKVSCHPARKREDIVACGSWRFWSCLQGSVH